jgi:hypothetical protein
MHENETGKVIVDAALKAGYASYYTPGLCMLPLLNSLIFPTVD